MDIKWVRGWLHSEADEAWDTKTTLNYGNKMEAIGEPWVEGGAIITVRADKPRSNADIAAKSATTKKSAERRCVSRHPQVDNSRITPPTPSKTTIVDYS